MSKKREEIRNELKQKYQQYIKDYFTNKIEETQISTEKNDSPQWNKLVIDEEEIKNSDEERNIERTA